MSVETTEAFVPSDGLATTPAEPVAPAYPAPVAPLSVAPTPITPYVPPAPAAETAPVAPAPARDEIERLDPQPLAMRLTSGTEFDLEPLKLRQFLRLLRIVTRGAADVLDQTRLNFEDPEEFLQNFIGMILFSIPEAEEETVDFLKSMVRPKNLTGDPKKDLLLIQSLIGELENPDLEDTITIIQCIVQTEAEDLRALGKRLGAMLQVADKLGATKSTAPTPQV